MTDRSALLNAAKERLGLTTDVSLAKRLGVGRAFLCMVKNGSKNLPNQMLDSMKGMCGWTEEEIEQLLGGANEDRALRAVPDVVGQVQHEPEVLPDTVLGADTQEPAGDEVRDREEGGRDGGSERADSDGESGADAAEEASDAKRPRLKRGTRAAIILIEGGIYYPDNPNSDHSHRRITGIVRQEGRKTVVVYSYGGDHLGICLRETFVRWMDPTRSSGKADKEQDNA